MPARHATTQRHQPPPHKVGLPIPHFSRTELCQGSGPDHLIGAEAIITVMRSSGFPNDPHVLAQGVAIISCENSYRVKGCNGIGACGAWQLGTTPATGSHTDPNTAQDFCKATRIAHSLWSQAGRTFDRDWADSADCWHPLVAGIQQQIESGKLAADPSNTIIDSAANAIKAPFDAVGNAVGDIVKLFARLFEPSFWVRVGKGILGVVMLVFGIVILMKALIGVDLGGYAEGIVGAVGGKRVRVMRAGVNPERRRYTEEELGNRAFSSQMARERAKTRGESARRQRFWNDLETARKERGEDVPF